MSGETTKYYKFKNTSGKLNVNHSIAKSLSWDSGDEICYLIKEFNEQIGLFFFKRKKENKEVNKCI